jgi:hypothetical protein
VADNGEGWRGGLSGPLCTGRYWTQALLFLVERGSICSLIGCETPQSCKTIPPLVNRHELRYIRNKDFKVQMPDP